MGKACQGGGAGHGVSSAPELGGTQGWQTPIQGSAAGCHETQDRWQNARQSREVPKHRSYGFSGGTADLPLPVSGKTGAELITAVS